MEKGLINCNDFDNYTKILKSYNNRYFRKGSNSLFSSYSNYDNLLNGRNSGLYNWLINPNGINKQTEEYNAHLSQCAFRINEIIDAYLDSERFAKLFDSIENSIKLRNIIYQLLTLFSSYKTTVLPNRVEFKIDDIFEGM